MVTIDTTGISKAIEAGNKAASETEITSKRMQLANLKIATIPLIGQPRYLTQEQYSEAVKVIKFLQEHNALTGEDVHWAESQGITIKNT